MNKLKFFSLGVFATIVAYPILCATTDLITTIIESEKMKFSAKMSKEINDSTHVIGFYAPEEFEEIGNE